MKAMIRRMIFRGGGADEACASDQYREKNAERRTGILSQNPHKGETAQASAWK